MLLVVYAHVLLGSDNSFITGDIFVTFRMPLFFFVSGFFAFRPLHIWNKQFYKRVFSQKFKAQILCTIIFYMFSRYVWGVNPFGWIYKGFQGYWFTIVLFQMFTLYAISNLISKLVHKNITLWLMAFISLITVGIFSSHVLEGQQWCKYLDSVKFCRYFQWFTVGLFARYYEEKFNTLISNNAFKTIFIIGFILLLCITLNDDIHINNMLRPVLGVVTSYFGLLTIILLFYNAKDFFYGNSAVAKSLRFTGQRTLDIYMLHYLLLPTVPALLEWLAPSSMIVFQLFVIFGIACMVTAVCLLISSCLRSSTILANWLFGVKPKKRSTALS